MLDGLQPIGALALLAIAAKAAGYGASLLAMGGALFLAVHSKDADARVRRLARQVAVVGAAAGLATLALRFGIRAARVSGMGMEGATDPVMLGFVWQSPLGAAALWRGAGEALILAVLLPGIVGHVLALAGAAAIAWSYTQVGHSLGDQRAWLAPLLTAHVLAIAYWAGSLAPLRRAAGGPDGAPILHRFGAVAAWVVALLAVAGTAMAWLLVGSVGGLLGTAYGLGLLAKVAVVTALLGLAARNKLRLVPHLEEGRVDAPAALRRSIAWEGACVAAILFLTAAITTATVPPVNL